MKFKFRLQTVLELRERQEDEAKQLLLKRRAASLEAESGIKAVVEQIRKLLDASVACILDRLEMEGRFRKLDDDKRLAEMALAVLRNEEESAETAWREKRKELEIMNRLREKALADWNYLEARREQNELDEWAVLRRVPA